MKLSKLLEIIRYNPLKSLVIAVVLIFPVFTPLIVQKYFNYSAINTSFAITITYFVVWKLYENREKIRSFLRKA